MIRAASARPSFFSSFAAAGTNSTVQAKLGFQIGQRYGILAPEIAQPLLREEEILEVVEMRLDRLARVKGLVRPVFAASRSSLFSSSPSSLTASIASLLLYIYSEKALDSTRGINGRSTCRTE